MLYIPKFSDLETTDATTPFLAKFTTSLNYVTPITKTKISITTNLAKSDLIQTTIKNFFLKINLCHIILLSSLAFLLALFLTLCVVYWRMGETEQQTTKYSKTETTKKIPESSDMVAVFPVEELLPVSKEATLSPRLKPSYKNNNNSNVNKADVKKPERAGWGKKLHSLSTNNYMDTHRRQYNRPGHYLIKKHYINCNEGPKRNTIIRDNRHHQTGNGYHNPNLNYQYHDHASQQYNGSNNSNSDHARPRSYQHNSGHQGIMQYLQMQSCYVHGNQRGNLQYPQQHQQYLPATNTINYNNQNQMILNNSTNNGLQSRAIPIVNPGINGGRL